MKKTKILKPAADKMVRTTDSEQKTEKAQTNAVLQKIVHYPFTWRDHAYVTGETILVTQEEYDRMKGNKYFEDEIETKKS